MNATARPDAQRSDVIIPMPAVTRRNSLRHLPLSTSDPSSFAPLGDAYATSRSGHLAAIAAVRAVI